MDDLERRTKNTDDAIQTFKFKTQRISHTCNNTSPGTAAHFGALHRPLALCLLERRLRLTGLLTHLDRTACVGRGPEVCVSAVASSCGLSSSAPDPKGVRAGRPTDGAASALHRSCLRLADWPPTTPARNLQVIPLFVRKRVRCGWVLNAWVRVGAVVGIVSHAIF